MDVDDPLTNDHFYDEIESLISPPGDYNLDDIEEILRSTDTQLDSSLNFNSFDPTNDLYNFDIRNEFKSDFSLPNCTSLQDNTQRTSSVSTSEDDGFNPDEFIKFLNDDSMKVDEFTGDSDCSTNGNNACPRRNTPSPTGSCSSSGGSSTSGIQSDASSVGSMTPAYVTQMETKSALMDNGLDCMTIENENNTIVSPTAVVPISVPLITLPSALATTTATTVLQQVPQIIQGTIIPVKTIPLHTVQQFNSVKPPTIHAPVKNGQKLAPKPNIVAPAPMQIISHANNNHHNNNSNNTNNNNSTSGNGGKITPPTNAKPKTIFLSSNDFKTLMQRMNSNGTKGGGAKISGSINTQMPKIIMKTPNGKVITTNKIVQPLSSGNNKTASNAHFMSKIGSHMMIKQQHQTSAKSEISSPPNPSVYKGIIDEKMFKKQQRMIKNRESASLSRKKKKEYVVSLETRINNLEKENFTLKGENKSLRSQLVAFAQTCHCKHSNISEFILNTLNAAENKPQHVKIAPKPAPKSLKQRMTAANIRKNVAVLFAMAFMVTLNVGNFQNFLNKNSLESSMAEQMLEEPLPQVAAASSGRRLLWVETEAEYNEKLNRSKRDGEMDVPPLHFLRPINRTAGGQQRNGNATTSSESNATVGAMNQTENLRLASSLRKWIGGNANYLNLSSHEKFGNDDLENPTGFKVTSDYYDMKNYDLPLQRPPPGSVMANKQKRKFYVDEGLSYGNKHQKLETENDNHNDNANSIELFKPKISEEYLRLFKGIKRQDDTFYVLSFNMDHILLPASNYNKSSRPKMSLMLPAGDPSLNGDVTLMQIDCEVTNTTELMLKSYMIPEKLRPSKFSKNANDVANNDTAGNQEKRERERKHERERFFRQPSAKTDESDDQQLRKPLTIKQKPVVRTFYLMGPKTQAAADAAKKKPTIIKLSGNDSVVNGVLSMKNSTLFSKMRETVTNDALP